MMPIKTMSNRSLSASLLAMIFALLSYSAWASDQVSLQLKWKHQFQFAGYYMALEKGYYRDADLDVSIIEAGDTTNPITQVLSGQAQFGISGPELAMLRAQGQPVVALAAIMQHSPLALLTQPNIESVQDLIGKRVMLLPYETELFAYLKREGVASTQIKAIPHSFNLKDLVNGDVDALSGYVTDEPYDLKLIKFPYKLFFPRSSGIDFYGDTLFTSEEEIQKNPTRVAAFREASLKGWRYAMDHPEETASLILSKYSQRHSLEHLLNEAVETRRLMYPDLVEIGHMSPARWHHIAEVYAEVGLIPADSSIDGLIYDPHPSIIPRWLTRSLWAGLILFVLTIFIAWRFHRISLRLENTLAERDQALADRRISEERLSILLDYAPMAVVVWQDNETITEWNQTAERTFGWTSDEALGKNLFDLMVPENHISKTRKDIQQGLLTGQTAPFLHPNITKEGKTILCAWSNARYRDNKGRSLGIISIAQDITEQTRTADALSESERRYRTLMEIAPFPVMVSRISDSSVVFCNHRASERLGLGSADTQGLYAPHFWEKPEDRAAFIAELMEKGFVFDREVQMRSIKGHNFWALLSAILIAKPGDASEAFVSFNDVNERKHSVLALQQMNMDLQLRLVEIEDLQQQLQEQAIRDSLTGLYNRRYLADTLEREVARARREGHPLALVIIDLDHFKQLNDSFGHQAGDTVLKIIAEQLMTDIRTEDLACRYGGEEFLIMLPGMGLDTAIEKAESWRKEFAELAPEISGKPVRITASFGVAIYPEHGTEPEDLIHAADTALYIAKRKGRNRVETARKTSG